MTRKEKTIETLQKAAYVVDCALLSLVTVLAGAVLVKSVQAETVNWTRVFMHKAFLIGFASFFVLLVIPRIRHNVRWLMTFMHEFTHMVFAVLFLRRIHRLNVDDRDSHVSFSSGPFGYIPITLSPYCIPLLTLILLPWRYTTDVASAQFLFAIDVLIGLTYAFHVCCWVRQAHFRQSDIIGPGKLRSSLFLLLFWMLGLSLVLLTPGSGVFLAFKRVFWNYPSTLVMQFIGLF